MAESRPLPASPRRLAEARRAGRVAWSPALVGAGATAGLALGVAAAGAGLIAAAGRTIAGAVATATGPDPVAAAGAVRAPAVIAEIAAAAVPLLAATGALALAAHLAQTRGAWLPRRAAPRLPASVDDAARRAGSTALDLARAAVLAVVAASFAITAAAALAGHHGVTAAAATRTGALAGALAGALLAHLAAAAIAVGLLDWLERARRLRADLTMSHRDAAEEQREAAGDPRWRRERARRRGVPDDADAVRAARVLIVAGDRAVAIAWHARWQPVPRVVAVARDSRGVTRLAALARRHGVVLHVDAVLADALATLEPGRVVAEAHHAALARVIVAIDR